MPWEDEALMRYVITADVALQLAAERVVLADEHQLVAPTLIRSQMLSSLYRQVRLGELDRAEADARMDHFRSMRPRLLGDRVLQRVAWRIAEQLGWDDTFDAEYVALTQLQADALITLDDDVVSAVGDLVVVAAIDVLR
jgi:predicted nucleic acid-binding protein